MAGKNNGGSSATLSPVEAVQAAEQAAVTAREQAVTDLTSTREGIVEQINGLVDQIVEIDTSLDGLGVEEFSVIDMTPLNYCIHSGAAPKRQRRSSGEGGSTGARGSKPTTLKNGLLIGMNSARKGTEFSIAEAAAAVQTDPVNYPFSGDEATINTQVNGALGGLVKSGHVERAGRGVYTITSDGQAAAKEALAAMKAKQSSE